MPCGGLRIRARTTLYKPLTAESIHYQRTPSRTVHDTSNRALREEVIQYPPLHPSELSSRHELDASIASHESATAQSRIKKSTPKVIKYFAWFGRDIASVQPLQASTPPRKPHFKHIELDPSPLNHESATEERKHSALLPPSLSISWLLEPAFKHFMDRLRTRYKLRSPNLSPNTPLSRPECPLFSASFSVIPDQSETAREAFLQDFVKRYAPFDIQLTPYFQLRNTGVEKGPRMYHRVGYAVKSANKKHRWMANKIRVGLLFGTHKQAINLSKESLALNTAAKTDQEAKDMWRELEETGPRIFRVIGLSTHFRIWCVEEREYVVRHRDFRFVDMEDSETELPPRVSPLEKLQVEDGKRDNENNPAEVVDPHGQLDEAADLDELDSIARDWPVVDDDEDEDL